MLLQPAALRDQPFADLQEEPLLPGQLRREALVEIMRPRLGDQSCMALSALFCRIVHCLPPVSVSMCDLFDFLEEVYSSIVTPATRNRHA
jgi:hypothetical protein